MILDGALIVLFDLEQYAAYIVAQGDRFNAVFFMDGTGQLQSLLILYKRLFFVALFVQFIAFCFQ